MILKKIEREWGRGIKFRTHKGVTQRKMINESISWSHKKEITRNKN
jgi:hypothetical protein